VRIAGILLATVGLSWPTAEALAQAPGPDASTDAFFDESEFEGPDEPDPDPQADEREATRSDPTGPAEEAASTDPALQPMPLPRRGTLRPSLEPESDDGPDARLPSGVRDDGPHMLTEEAVRRALERRASAAAVGDAERKDLATRELLEIKRNLGLRNLVLGSAVLLREARVELDAGRPKRAADLSRYAAQLSPDLPASHWMLARSLWAEDPSQVVQVAAALRGLVGATFGTFRNAVSFWGWVLGVSVGALGIVIAGYAVVQLAKYVRYPASDIAQRLPGVLGTGEFSLALWIVVLLPMAFGLGLTTSVALALAVPFAYQGVKERILTGVFGAVLAAGPLTVAAVSPFVLFHGSEADVLASALTESLSPDVRARFRALSADASDLRVRVQAYRARQRGEIDEAVRLYAEALRSRPDDPVLLNNSAVLDLQQGNEELARPKLVRASTSDLAEPRLNLSLLLADEGDFARADRLLEEARRLDPGLTAAFTEFEGSKTTRQRLLEVPLNDNLLWSQLASHDPEERAELVRQAWEPVGGRIPPEWFPVWVLTCALGAAVVHRRRRNLSVGCTRCGRPAARGEQKPLCEQCFSVFITGAAVEAQMRREKEAEVRGYQRRRRLVERLMGPVGLGLVWGERPLLGVGVALVIAFVGLAVWTMDAWTVSAWTVRLDGGLEQIGMVALLALAVLAAGVSLQKSFER
jgi:tetratricopeptide (TPR) repeat protein